jgi:hypothetical protein
MVKPQVTLSVRPLFCGKAVVFVANQIYQQSKVLERIRAFGIVFKKMMFGFSRLLKKLQICLVFHMFWHTFDPLCHVRCPVL